MKQIDQLTNQQLARCAELLDAIADHLAELNHIRGSQVQSDWDMVAGYKLNATDYLDELYNRPLEPGQMAQALEGIAEEYGHYYVDGTGEDLTEIFEAIDQHLIDSLDNRGNDDN